jgi:sugar phosphate isomerase/epimerase
MDLPLIPSFHPATIRQGLSLEERCQIAEAAGFSYTAVNLGEATAFDRERGAGAFAALLEGHGLNAGGMFGVPSSTADSEEYARDLAVLPERCEMAQSLGGTNIMHFVPNRTSMPEAEFEALCVARFAEIGAALAGYDLKLAIEWLGPKQLEDLPYPFRSGIKMALDLAEASGQSNIGILVDAVHMWGARQAMADIERLAAGRVFAAHIDDFPEGDPDVLIDDDRIMPGDGIIDLAAFCRHTVAAGYSGPIEVELFNPAIRLRDPVEVSRVAREKSEAVIAAALG